MGFIHVGQDLEEQQELLECLLAFYMQYLLANDAVTCIQSGMLCPPKVACPSAVAICMQYLSASIAFACIKVGRLLSIAIVLPLQLRLRPALLACLGQPLQVLCHQICLS